MVRIARTVVGILVSLLPVCANALASCIALTHDVPLTRIQALSRGFNLDGQLDRLNMPPLNTPVLRELRSKGMTSIRLPVPAESVMSRFSAEEQISRQLGNLNKTIAELLSLGYAVSIDLHPGGRFQRLHKDNPASAMSVLQDAWGRLTQVIGRFSPERVFAELMNEPEVPSQQWQTDVEALARFVRQRLPDTTLIVGPTNWQRADSLPDLRPLDDANVVYAIHFYDPMVFTHQGHWDEKNPLSSIKELPFPIRRDDKTVSDIRTSLVVEGKERALKELDTAIAASEAGDVIARELQPAITWQHKYKRPLIVNEFGVLKHHAPRASRLTWLGSVARLAEQNCWGWTHWEFGHGFGLLNTDQTIDEDVIRALLDHPR